jgi:hypothetical protein
MLAVLRVYRKNRTETIIWSFCFETGARKGLAAGNVSDVWIKFG